MISCKIYKNLLFFDYENEKCAAARNLIVSFVDKVKPELRLAGIMQRNLCRLRSRLDQISRKEPDRNPRRAAAKSVAVRLQNAPTGQSILSARQTMARKHGELEQYN